MIKDAAERYSASLDTTAKDVQSTNGAPPQHEVRLPSSSSYASVKSQPVEALLATATEPVSVDASRLRSRWDEFIKWLPQSQAAVKLSVASEDICSVRFFDGEIMVLITEKFLVDDLHARRAALANHLQKFYGAPVKLTAVHTSEIKPRLESTDTQLSELASSNMEASKQTHEAPPAEANTKLPIEKLLVDLFGAKKIPLSL